MDKPRGYKIEIYLFLTVLSFSLLTVGMASATNWWRDLPSSRIGLQQANRLGIEGSQYLTKDEIITLKANVESEFASGSYSWSEDDPGNKIEILGETNTPELKVKGQTVSTRLGDARLILTFRPGKHHGKNKPLRAIYPLSVLKTEIKPDRGQKGITGAEVPSTQDNPKTSQKEGQKHYVSPRKEGASVILKAKVTPAVNFNAVLEWEGGESVPGYPEKRRVERNNPEKTHLKVKIKKTESVMDEMLVWVVFAKITPTRVQETALEDGLVDPRRGPVQAGKLVISQWRFTATIMPPSIISPNPLSADIPDLTGRSTVDVPEANKKHITTGYRMRHSAERKWDISRQMRIRVHSPSLNTNDYDESIKGQIYQGLSSENKMVIDYPQEEAEGNDDIGTADEDNNPYSSAETKPGASTKTPSGDLASSDLPVGPVWIKTTSAGGDKLEWRFYFREFVRLEIGKKWFLISDFGDGEWKHVAKAEKDVGDWVDDGSYTETGNLGFNEPF